MTLNWEPMKVSIQPFREPRGFIKILQWFFAICAFATTVNYSADYSFTIRCTTNVTVEIKNHIEYPFAVDASDPFEATQCGRTKTGGLYTFHFIGNAQSDAQYFVCTGVLSFLYAMIAGAIYLLHEKTYQVNNIIPVIDFGITLVLAIFWISATAAWGKGASTLSDATYPHTVFMQSIKHYDPQPNENLPVFLDFKSAHFSKLVISILFGVINFILWAGNLWFLYKETTWFESIMKHSTMRSSGTSSSNV